MRGINAETGKALEGRKHLYQSIKDILTTPIGSRVMLREYGCRVFELIDAPINNSTIIDIYVSIIEALRKWEPRISVSKVSVYDVVKSHITIKLEGTYTPDGTPIVIDGLVL